jgi:hypothetical protein
VYPDSYAESAIPRDTDPERCEEAELVEEADAIARLLAASWPDERAVLLRAAFRNFARALKSELRTFTSTIDTAAYDAVKSVLTDELRVMQLLNEHVDDVVDVATEVVGGRLHAQLDETLRELLPNPKRGRKRTSSRAVLARLLDASPEWVTYDELYKEVGFQGGAPRRNGKLSSQAVYQTVIRLRKELPSGWAIENRQGLGYRLVRYPIVPAKAA